MLRSSVLVLFFWVSAAAGQDKDKVELKKPAPQAKSTAADSGPAGKVVAPAAVPGDVEVSFLNGSLVRMLLQADKLEIATPYGQLAVPMTDVRGIEFGLHFPEGLAAKIDQAVKNLGATEYRERDKAGKLLIESGPYSYPAAYEASCFTDLEIARRAKEVVKQLQARHPKKDLKTSTEDKVVTPTFTVVGRILTPTIKAKTELFGQVELSIAKMRTLKAVAAPGLDADVTVDAAKYANAGQWMDTNFHVDGRSALVISAKGLVDTWPQGPGQYMVGPNGNQGVRQALGGGAIILGGRKAGGVIGGQMYGGVLLGKIGDDGEPFIIGDRYEGNPESEGKLYLHIGPSPWNCMSTGTYDVKITRK